MMSTHPYRWLVALSVFVLSAQPFSLPRAVAQSGGGWSAWQSAAGDGKVQYRWSAGVIASGLPKCDYELRNSDSSDQETYYSKFSYIDTQGGDEISTGKYLNKTLHENSGYIAGCKSVSSVSMMVRPHS